MSKNYSIKPKIGRLNLIIGSDVNAHSRIWGDKKKDARGKRVYEFLLENNLILLNTGSKATFRCGTKTSIIDLTICSKRIYKYLNNWKVLEDDSYSDHSYLSFDPKFDATEPSSTRIKKTLTG